MWNKTKLQNTRDSKKGTTRNPNILSVAATTATISSVKSKQQQFNSISKKQRNKQTTQHRYCHHQDKTSFTTVCNQQAASEHVIRLRCIEQRRTEIIVHCIDICAVGKKQLKYVRSVGQTRRQVKSAAETQRSRSPFITTWSDFSDLVDLWVIKMKSPWSFAHVIRREHVNRARNTSLAPGICERFVHSMIKLTRVYDYPTWPTYFWRNSRGTQSFSFFLFLDCAFRLALIG